MTRQAVMTTDLVFTGNGRRILGDFSNALPGRVMLQSTVANSLTASGLMPSGTGTGAYWQLFQKSDLANSPYLEILINATEVQLSANRTGTGAFLPLYLVTGGVTRMTISITGAVTVPGTLGVSGVTTTAGLANTGVISTTTLGASGQIGVTMTPPALGNAAYGDGHIQLVAPTGANAIPRIGFHESGSTAIAIYKAQGSEVFRFRGASGNDWAFVFDAMTQTLTNKTLTAATLNGITIQGDTRFRSAIFYIGASDQGWMQYHTSGYCQFSHSFLTGGTGIYFNASASYGMVWQGTGFSFTHPVITGGNRVYLESSLQVYLEWNASYSAVWVPYSLGLQASYLAARGGQITIMTATALINFVDGNVHIRRDTGSNVLGFRAYDGVFDFRRQADSVQCGYVDTSGFHNASTLRDKRNIRDLEDGLSLVLDERVRPIRFMRPGTPSLHTKTMECDYTTPGVADRESMGFGAEHMAQVIPEVVAYDEQGEPAAINYGALVPVLWAAVRALNARLEALENAA